MKVAYADPPYLGCGSYYAKLHPESMQWNNLETHKALIDRLSSEFEAWALSLHSPSLQAILPLCPNDVRVGAWVKPFASFKPGINPAYCWEPVIFRGGRKRDRKEWTCRDWIAESITLRRGLTGAKPENFCFWVFDFLGLQIGDELHDLFPGTGGVSRAWKTWINTPRLPLAVPMVRTGKGEHHPLFANQD